MGKLISFTLGACVGAGAVMGYLHRGVIIAVIKGEELPEAPEGCPAFKESEPAAEEPAEAPAEESAEEPAEAE